MKRMIGAALITAFVGSAAWAGSPPPWLHDRANATRANSPSNAGPTSDPRDEAQPNRGSDWKRRGDPQRTDQNTSNQPARPAPVQQNRPPVTHQAPPSGNSGNDRNRAGNDDRTRGGNDDRTRGGNDDRTRGSDDNRGRAGNDDRGDRRGFNDPRPNTNRTRDQHNQSLRDWNERRHDDRNSRSQASWRDSRGHIWHQDRSWYNRYRVDHFRFYQGRYFARDRFRFGVYYAPYGFRSRIWLTGQYLPFAYYDRDYSIDSYWSFGLYDPPFGTRWVRSGNDALLVDYDTGEVIDAVYNLFW